MYNQPKPLFSARAFGGIVEKALAVATAADPVRAIALLVGRLHAAVDAEVPKRLHSHSNIWRSSITGSPDYVRYQNHTQYLICRLHELLSQLLSEGRVDVSSIASDVIGTGSNIHRRINLAVLAQSDISNAAIVEAILLNGALFNESDLRTEFWAFAKHHVHQLNEDDKEKFIDLIRDDESMPASLGESQRDIFLNQRERDRLSAIEADLNANAWARLDELTRHLGAASDLTAGNWPQAAAFGPASPILDEDAKSSVSQLVHSLLVWDAAADPAANEFFGPSPEGGSRDLRLAVKDAPNDISMAMSEILQLEATYLRGIVAGLDDALRIGTNLDWPASLQLCQWIAERPPEDYAQIGFMGRDPNWTWAKRSVANFILDALSQHASLLPKGSRALVWSLLEKLVDDPDPSANDVDDSSPAHYSNQAVGSVRGTALLAVVSYMSWIYTETYGDKLQSETTATTDLYPEAIEVLDRHADTQSDSSLAIRAVYGQRFSLLSAIAYPWVERQTQTLFGEIPYTSDSTRVTWEAYLIFSQVTARTLKLLATQYAHAVESIGAMAPEDLPKEHDALAPYKELVDHVFSQAVFAQTPTMAENQLFARMMDVAPQVLLAHLMWYASQFLNQEPSVQVLAKIEEFVDGRIGIATAAADPGAFAGELKKLGDWFGDDFHGDNKWLLERTKIIIEMYGDIDSCYRVLETMVGQSSTYPQLVLDCIELLASGSRDRWSFVGAQSFVLDILKSVRATDPTFDPQVQRIASHMLRRGWLQFREL